LDFGEPWCFLLRKPVEVECTYFGVERLLSLRGFFMMVSGLLCGLVLVPDPFLYTYLTVHGGGKHTPRSVCKCYCINDMTRFHPSENVQKHEPDKIECEQSPSADKPVYL
jgi:hypothetical protein